LFAFRLNVYTLAYRKTPPLLPEAGFARS